MHQGVRRITVRAAGTRPPVAGRTRSAEGGGRHGGVARLRHGRDGQDAEGCSAGGDQVDTVTDEQIAAHVAEIAGGDGRRDAVGPGVVMPDLAAGGRADDGVEVADLRQLVFVQGHRGALLQSDRRHGDLILRLRPR